MIKVKQEKDDKWVDKREGGEIVIWCESEIWTIGNREREKDEKEENEEGFVYWNWKEKQMKDLRIRDEERRKKDITNPKDDREANEWEINIWAVIGKGEVGGWESQEVD